MDDMDMLIGLGIVWLLAKYSNVAVPELQQKGAQLFEATHPRERNHADDLPGHQLTRSAVEAIAARAGFPDPHLAGAIAFAESGGVPNAQGDGGVSIGLWQINTRAWPAYSIVDMADPTKNAKAAFQISKKGTDWSHWSAFKSGAYRRYL